MDRSNPQAALNRLRHHKQFLPLVLFRLGYIANRHVIELAQSAGCRSLANVNFHMTGVKRKLDLVPDIEGYGQKARHKNWRTLVQRALGRTAVFLPDADDASAMDAFNALILLSGISSHHEKPSMKGLPVKFRGFATTPVVCRRHRLIMSAESRV